MAFRFVLSSLLLAASAVGTLAHGEPSMPFSFGESLVPLNGPWKFQIGDSPADPRTGQPLWAKADFDDSQWGTGELTPRPGLVDPFTGDPRYVPGWTTRGHSGYWGYAWYRIRVSLAAGDGTG